MAKKTEISQDNFEMLLTWLNPDREKASQKYETIRATLIRIFLARGSYPADELADETIDRVTGKIKRLSKIYRGDPALYFYGVANKIFLEFLKKPQTEELPAALAQKEKTDEELKAYYECLETCLENLAPESRKLILNYYQYENQKKKELRKKLAKRVGLSANALRIKMIRIRNDLRKCIIKCL
jgi:DNA-directed RNA polymerase specialized sigma24 family protein